MCSKALKDEFSSLPKLRYQSIVSSNIKLFWSGGQRHTYGGGCWSGWPFEFQGPYAKMHKLNLPVYNPISFRRRASFRSSISTPAWIRKIWSVLLAGASTPTSIWSLTFYVDTAASAPSSSSELSDVLTNSHTDFLQQVSSQTQFDFSLTGIQRHINFKNIGD